MCCVYFLNTSNEINCPQLHNNTTLKQHEITLFSIYNKMDFLYLAVTFVINKNGINFVFCCNQNNWLMIIPLNNVYLHIYHSEISHAKIWWITIYLTEIYQNNKSYLTRFIKLRKTYLTKRYVWSSCWTHNYTRLTDKGFWTVTRKTGASYGTSL